LSLRPIILAEDNEKLRRLYTDLLEANGFTVMAVSDGEKAIALLYRVASPQLIILDIMMPRLNGIETCIRIRKMHGVDACPILFLTALDRPETLLECLLAGGDDYLMKSAPLAEILERVQYWSRRGALEDMADRRARAIKELQVMVLDMDERALSILDEEDGGEEAGLSHLVEFLLGRIDELAGEHDPLFRFGYLVGTVEVGLPAVEGRQVGSKRILRKLALRTDFVDRKEIDALLENYALIVTQNKFRSGWLRGREAAATLALPQQARLMARLQDD
jgi:DNA-binding response OmpR family regulator